LAEQRAVMGVATIRRLRILYALLVGGLIDRNVDDWHWQARISWVLTSEPVAWSRGWQPMATTEFT